MYYIDKGLEIRYVMDNIIRAVATAPEKTPTEKVKFSEL